MSYINKISTKHYQMLSTLTTKYGYDEIRRSTNVIKNNSSIDFDSNWMIFWLKTKLNRNDFWILRNLSLNYSLDQINNAINSIEHLNT